jgi:phosphatidylserine decarboxylase
VNNVELPIWARERVLGLYVWAFSVNLSEAADADLKRYRNLAEFFRRPLKTGCRPVDQTAAITCPSDGMVLHCGKVNGDCVEQVKGVTYSLRQFLGPADWIPLTTNDRHVSLGTSDFGNAIKCQGKDTQLYHAVIYLSPGDYHRFHSPTEWTVAFRRYFPGLLLSVSPWIARHIPGLFVLNERVVYVGQWQHGFMSLTAVGATNVGSIRIYHDRHLKTNTGHHTEPYLDRFYRSPGNQPQTVSFTRGDAFGEFNLGSTIVVLFEAPKTFEFVIEPGQKVKYGQIIGR